MKEKVTSPKWSLALVEAGVKVETDWIWLPDQDGHVLFLKEGLVETYRRNAIPAPLCVELLSLLPDGAGLEKVGEQFFAWSKADKYSYKEIPADNPCDALAQLAIWLKNKGLLEGEG